VLETYESTTKESRKGECAILSEPVPAHVDFTPKDMYQYKSAKRLFDNIREGSREVFAIGLARYCTFWQKNPDEIILDRKITRKAGIEAMDEEIETTHEEKFAEFSRWLTGIKQANGNPLSPNTIQSNMTAAAAFYSRNYGQLQKPERPDAYNVRPLHVPTPEETGKMLQILEGNPAKMAVVAGAFQSGMGAGDLVRVKYSDVSDTYGSVREQLDNGISFEGKNYPLLHIQRIRGKTRIRFDTFLGRLTTSILKRQDYPQSEYVFPVSVRYFERIVEDASKQEKMFGQTTPHCLRKAFTTTLKLANMNSDVIEAWTGHSIGGVRQAYYKPPVSEQLRLYLEAEKKLTPPQFSSLLTSDSS
jgi:integrase